MHLLQQALTDCESSTLISQDFSIVTQRVAPEADGNLLTPGAPCSVPTAHLPLGPGDPWEVWGLGLAPLSWGRAAFRSHHLPQPHLPLEATKALTMPKLKSQANFQLLCKPG